MIVYHHHHLSSCCLAANRQSFPISIPAVDYSTLTIAHTYRTYMYLPPATSVCTLCQFATTMSVCLHKPAWLNHTLQSRLYRAIAESQHTLLCLAYCQLLRGTFVPASPRTSGLTWPVRRLLERGSQGLATASVVEIGGFGGVRCGEQK